MKLKNAIMIAVGSILVLLGAVGLFVPVWPTTPFVLLAVGCFSCAPRLRERLLRIRFIRAYYDSYHTGVGLPKRSVAQALVFLWGMLALSVLLTRKLWIAALLAAIGIAVTVHILHIARPNPNRRRVAPVNTTEDRGWSNHDNDEEHGAKTARDGADAGKLRPSHSGCGI